MCGKGGLLGTGLFASQPAPKVPKIEAAAPPAPERKQDTGAIVAIGNDDSDAELRARAAMTKQKGGSSIGGFGSPGSFL